MEEQWIRRMSEQQSAPEQLAAGKSQGGAGATYKVLEQLGLLIEELLPGFTYVMSIFYMEAVILSSQGKLKGVC